MSPLVGLSAIGSMYPTSGIFFTGGCTIVGYTYSYGWVYVGQTTLWQDTVLMSWRDISQLHGKPAFDTSTSFIDRSKVFTTVTTSSTNEFQADLSAGFSITVKGSTGVDANVGVFKASASYTEEVGVSFIGETGYRLSFNTATTTILHATDVEEMLIEGTVNSILITAYADRNQKIQYKYRWVECNGALRKTLVSSTLLNEYSISNVYFEVDQFTRQNFLIYYDLGTNHPLLDSSTEDWLTQVYNNGKNLISNGRIKISTSSQFNGTLDSRFLSSGSADINLNYEIEETLFTRATISLQISAATSAEVEPIIGPTASVELSNTVSTSMSVGTTQSSATVANIDILSNALPPGSYSYLTILSLGPGIIVVFTNGYSGQSMPN